MKNTKRLKIIGLIIIGTSLLCTKCMCTDPENDNTNKKAITSLATNSSITYQVDNNEILNPERGMYKHTETFASNYEALSQSSLNALKTSNISLILRVFYLDSYLNSDIGSSYITNMQNDFNKCRLAGVKCIVRFAYIDDVTTGSNNPNKARILTHITQLAPVINNNKDVIACIQAGFLGTWGEWYYTDYFGIGNLTLANLADRTEILNKELSSFDPSLQICVRTPKIKMNVFGSTPLTLSEASVVTNKSRVGQHNDAILGSSTDEGTYTSGTTNIANEKAYLAEESKYVFNGGETNQLNTTYQNCTNTLSSFAQFHYTYLNNAYYPQTLTYWNTNGCLTTIKKNLGYRFEMVNSTLSGDLLTIKIKNTGFANLINKRNVYLILRHSNGTEYNVVLNTTPKFWSSGTTITITQSLTGLSLPSGTYKLFLQLPDINLTTNKNYSIRMCNKNTWESNTGYNNLLLTYIR